MLNIRKAFELIELLNPFIPEPNADDDILDFVGKIVHGIRISNTPEVFADALTIMYGFTLDDLSNLSGIDAVLKFSNGLKENKILSLCEFYQWLMT